MARFACYYYLQDEKYPSGAKYSCSIQANSWEEAADRAEEIGLVPNGLLLEEGHFDPITDEPILDWEFYDWEKFPPCPKNIRHRFSD